MAWQCKHTDRECGLQGMRSPLLPSGRLPFCNGTWRWLGLSRRQLAHCQCGDGPAQVRQLQIRHPPGWRPVRHLPTNPPPAHSLSSKMTCNALLIVVRHTDLASVSGCVLAMLGKQEGARCKGRKLL